MWFQLNIEQCPSHAVEELSHELEELGTLSITFTDKHDNPVLEPEPGTTPLWPEVVLHALYAQAEEAQRIKTYLHNIYPHLHCEIEIIEDKDWERVWMDEFKPQRFGQRLWICPTWLTPPDPHAVNLMLDPGLAFGTGTHPTTALCLTWLEQADLRNKMLIDYGCGSGILSLAALKLGAQKVCAVDIDPQALQATKNNAQSNQINESQLAISQPEALHQPVDLIIANILLAPLTTLKERFYQLLHPDALLVVSGLLAEQMESLANAYQDRFTVRHSQEQEGWGLMVFKMESNHGS